MGRQNPAIAQTSISVDLEGHGFRDCLLEVIFFLHQAAARCIQV